MPVELKVARLASLGATKVDIGQREVSWTVMADPERNEFQVLSPRDDLCLNPLVERTRPQAQSMR